MLFRSRTKLAMPMSIYSPASKSDSSTSSFGSERMDTGGGTSTFGIRDPNRQNYWHYVRRADLEDARSRGPCPRPTGWLMVTTRTIGPEPHPSVIGVFCSAPFSDRRGGRESREDGATVVICHPPIARAVRWLQFTCWLTRYRRTLRAHSHIEAPTASSGFRYGRPLMHARD